jgi:hypothetical protein
MSKYSTTKVSWQFEQNKIELHKKSPCPPLEKGEIMPLPFIKGGWEGLYLKEEEPHARKN